MEIYAEPSELNQKPSFDYEFGCMDLFEKNPNVELYVYKMNTNLCLPENICDSFKFVRSFSTKIYWLICFNFVFVKYSTISEI